MVHYSILTPDDSRKRVKWIYAIYSCLPRYTVVTNFAVHKQVNIVTVPARKVIEYF